jgi:integrase
LEAQEIFLLQQLSSCGNLDLDVLESIDKMKKDSVLSKHPYQITQQNNGEKRWQTYVMDEHTHKRRKVTATSEKKLIDKLFIFYYEETAVTLRKLYPEWLDKRKTCGISPRTVKRNENHWDKYYSGNPIVDVPIHKLTAEHIEDYFHTTIRKFNLTTKELGNMKYIFVDIMKLAFKRKYITYNPFTDVDINTNGCKPQSKKNSTSRVYLPNEKEELFKVLNSYIDTYPQRTDGYAIFLLFKLGLRIGELVALKWSDIDYSTNELHIHRMESMVNETDEKLIPAVVEYTKRKSPYGDRFLPLGDYEILLFQKIKQINYLNNYSDDDFIFCNDNGRILSRSIDKRIRKCCVKAGIEVKSAHDIRRTVASEMFKQGVPVVIIKQYLGHSDIKTTYEYILDNNQRNETHNIIIKSLSDMNGLKRTQTPQNTKVRNPA